MFGFMGDVITQVRARAASLAIGLSLGVVAGTTGFVSYTHISALTMALGQSWKTAHLYPLFIDGQIVIGSVIYMTLAGRKRWLGLAGIVPGVLESLFANWESAATRGPWLHGLEAHAWATVAAQAFAVSSFLFERWLKEQSGPRAKATVASVLSAAPLAMAKIAAELFPQAPEPDAPGPEPTVTACRDLGRALSVGDRPEGAPWGLVSPAAAPEPEPEQVRFVFTVPTVGPAVSLAQRPRAAARPRRPQAVPAEDDARLPLPAGEAELRELVASTTRNDLYRTYQVSKHKADQLRQQYLTDSKEVA